MHDYKEYSISRAGREPLLRFALDALGSAGCRILRASESDRAPFRITFETPEGERSGIILYAFTANSKRTKNRPPDEHRFQIKYGSQGGGNRPHEIWQDPFLLYTTLFCGINTDLGFFVGADPVFHSPTKFFISLEFKEREVEEIRRTRWHAWERRHRQDDEEPVEVLVGGTPDSFLRYVRFEREAMGEEQGHRMLLAERGRALPLPATADPVVSGPIPGSARLHTLAEEFEMSDAAVLTLIANARRLKMAVRGYVAEEHLVRHLQGVKGVTECRRLDEEGGPDIALTFEGVRLTVECKNALRQTAASGQARIDFQRTRISKGDKCSRFYSPSDFDIIAGCLHAVTEKWEFRYQLTSKLAPNRSCPNKLSNNVRVDGEWRSDPVEILKDAAAARSR